jgi:hypothetical protein
VKKPKPWRLVEAWHPHEWAPFKEAWQRAEAVLGSSLWLIQHDLRQDFLEEQLIAAVRRIASDGTETRIILKPEYWQQLKINYAWSITGWEAEAREGEQWVFLVRRRELDKRYPIAPLGRPGTNGLPSVDLTADAPRQKPGPKYKDDWPIVMASEMIRLALSPRDREMLQNVAALGRYMKEFLQEQIGSAPKDPGAIEEMLRVLLQRVR